MQTLPLGSFLCATGCELRNERINDINSNFAGVQLANELNTDGFVGVQVQAGIILGFEEKV